MEPGNAFTTTLPVQVLTRPLPQPAGKPSSEPLAEPSSEGLGELPGKSPAEPLGGSQGEPSGDPQGKPQGKPHGEPHGGPSTVPQPDWQELDTGPGYIALPAGHEIMLRARGLNDARLATLIEEVGSLASLTGLNLSENRNVTDAGLVYLKALPGIKYLNLSSCSLTSTGLTALKSLPRLTRLDLSYCNRLTDAALKPLASLPALEYLNLQGCVKITNGGVARLRRRGLEIHK